MSSKNTKCVNVVIRWKYTEQENTDLVSNDRKNLNKLKKKKT